MKRTKSQFARLLELDRRLRAKEYPNCITFGAEWEVSQKTIQRDIDYLRDQLGAPIGYDRDKKGFYYTDASWFLPSLSMSEGDLVAILIASQAFEAFQGTPVADQLHTVFEKLAGLLPDRVSVRPEELFGRFTFVTPPARRVSEQIWVAVVRGLTNRLWMRIRYRSFEAKTGRDLTVMPQHLANLQGEWYLFARCEGEELVRQFTAARIETAEVTNRHFELPADVDVSKLTANSFGRFASGKSFEVKLLFKKEIADWVLERQWHPQQKIRKRKNGEVELQFPAKGLYEVQRWVLSWGADCRVLAPKELAENVRREVGRMKGNSSERHT